MLCFFVVANEAEFQNCSRPPRVSIDGGVHCFLNRYFVHANLSPGSLSFMDEYADTRLHGYQLHRFRAEMENAQLDLEARSGHVQVLCEWSGGVQSVENEFWRSVDVNELRQTISQLLELATEAEAQNKFVYAMGD